MTNSINNGYNHERLASGFFFLVSVHPYFPRSIAVNVSTNEKRPVESQHLRGLVGVLRVVLIQGFKGVLSLLGGGAKAFLGAASSSNTGVLPSLASNLFVPGSS